MDYLAARGPRPDRPQSAGLMDRPSSHLSSLLPQGRDHSLSTSWTTGMPYADTQEHPAIKLLDDLTRLSTAEVELQKKSDILSSLKLELARLLQNQREKDVRYVEMEETLDTVQLSRSIEDHLQMKVDKLTKDLKSSKKKCSELSSEVGQANLRIRGLQEELDSERSACKELRQRLSSLEKSLEQERFSAATVRQDTTRERNHSVAQLEKKLQGQVKELEEKLLLSRAAETASTTRMRELEKELRGVHSESVSLAQPWVSHQPLPSQYNAVACVQELSAKCQQFKGRERELSQQIQRMELGLLQSNNTLDEVTDVLKDSVKDFDNVTCDALLSILSQVSAKLSAGLSSDQRSFHSSPLATSASTSPNHSGGESDSGDDDGQTRANLPPRASCLLKRALSHLVSLARGQLEQVHTAHLSLRAELTQGCEGVGVAKGSAEEMVRTVVAKLKEAQEREKELNEQLCATKHDHEVSWNGAMAALKTAAEERTTTAVQAARLEEKTSAKKETSQLVEELTQQQTTRLIEKGRENDALKQTIDDLNQMVSSKEQNVLALETEESELGQKIQSLEQTVMELKGTLKQNEQQHQESLSQANQECSTVQEVSHQHALTIVVMEKKLVAAVNRIASLQASLSQQQQQVQEQREKNQVGEADAEKDAAKESWKEEKQRLIEDLQGEHSKQMAQLEEQLSAEKHQLSLTAQRYQELEKRFGEIELELDKATGGLRTAVASSGQFKGRLEDLNKRFAQQEQELASNQAEVDSLKTQLSERDKSVKDLEQSMQGLRSPSSRSLHDTGGEGSTPPSAAVKTASPGRLLRRPKTTSGQWSSFTSTSSSAVDLGELGAVCISERHRQIIGQQKQTLKELRTKIKELSEEKPPTPSRLALIHKTQELSYKVNTLESEAGLRGRMEGSCPPEGMEAQTQTASTLEGIPVCKAQDLQVALEASEHMLIHLLIGLCECLSFEPLPPSTSVVHLQPGERADLTRERRKSVKVVSGQVEKLVKMLQAKEKLLHTTKKEVTELMHSQQENLESTASTASLAEEQGKKVKRLTEELADVRDDLDQQKRLNESLIKRKRLSEDQQKRQSHLRTSHSCMATPEEMKYKLQRQKASHGQQLQKKALEITGLSKELRLTNQKLESTALRLKAVEGNR